MSDAPERITIHYCTACGTYPVFLCLCDIEDGEEIGKAEYVRADIHRREMVAFDQLEAEVARLREAYEDLIMQVHQKVSGESRHDTAKRMLVYHRDYCLTGGPCEAEADQC